jgi:stage IV sporulation protein FB
MTIARIAGTAVRVHVTFLLLLAYYAWRAYTEAGLAGASEAVILLLVLFSCVLLHEFGHILMARRFGVLTPEVLLLPIGGVARLERIPDEPRQELLIALAGPLVTLVIVLGTGATLATHGVDLRTLFLEKGDDSLLGQVFYLNSFLLLFNLAPVFPMDGGRVLRAALAWRLGLARGTRIAVVVGQLGAVLMAFIALTPPINPVLALVATFVFFGAGTELQMVELRESVRALTVEKVMRRDVLPVHMASTLAQPADLMLAGLQQHFPVIDTAAQVQGLLTHEGLIRGLADRGGQSRIEDAMTASVPRLGPLEGLDSTLALLDLHHLPALPVTDVDGRLLGMITREQLTDVVHVQRSARRREHA